MLIFPAYAQAGGAPAGFDLISLMPLVLIFVVFYLLCGLAATAAQTLSDPASPIPMVGASGAVSGILGGYLVLYPRVRVHLLVFVFFVTVPAWFMLGYWFAVQLLSGIVTDSAGGVAFWAHVGGFVAGVIFIKGFARPQLTMSRIRTERAPFAPSLRRRRFL